MKMSPLFLLLRLILSFCLSKNVCLGESGTIRGGVLPLVIKGVYGLVSATISSSATPPLIAFLANIVYTYDLELEPLVYDLYVVIWLSVYYCNNKYLAYVEFSSLLRICENFKFTIIWTPYVRGN